MSLHYPKPHHNHAAEYQCSGIPFVTSSNGANSLGTTPLKVSFPYVTRWIQVFNLDAAGEQDLRVGFSENGVNGNPANNAHYLIVPAGSSSPRLEVKCKEVYLRADSGATSFSLAAGLTNVSKSQFPTLTGSAGVGGVG